jgi:hypothetical protein
MVASSLRKGPRETSSGARRRSELLHFCSGCWTRLMYEQARRMRRTKGGMALIIRPAARHRATTISTPCPGYLTNPWLPASRLDRPSRLSYASRATHESFCSTRPSASAGLHTIYTLPVVRWWGAASWGKGSVLTEGYPHHIPTSKSQPAACLLPGIDTSGGREWFNPNRVWTAPPVRAVILLGWRAGPCKPEGARPCPLCART